MIKQGFGLAELEKNSVPTSLFKYSTIINTVPGPGGLFQSGRGGGPRGSGGMLPGGGPLGGPWPGGGPWNGCKHNAYMNAKDTFQVTKYDTTYTYKQQLT